MSTLILRPRDNRNVIFKSIKLENFQVHKDITVNLSPTITTIRGATDAGKSAVLRALRWACLNDIAGADFIREGAKRVTVTLTVSSGLAVPASFEITRSKAKDGTGNTYALDGHEYKAFGQGVPPDIAATLSINEINFQGQFDSPFWFADTAGEVSRKLNSVIDLSIIDTTLANIGTEVRRAVERKSLCEERLKEAKEQLEELAPQKDRVEEFKNVKHLAAFVVSVTEDYDKLFVILAQIDFNRAKKLAAKAEDGTELLTAMLAARRAERAVEILHQIIHYIIDAQANVQPPPDFSPVQMAWSNWIVRRDRAEKLSELFDLVIAARTTENSKHFEAQQAEARFHAQVRGKVCPLCNQIIQLDNRA